MEKIFPKVMENRSNDLPIRIWVPGCSTGEEVYSIAINLVEYLGETQSNISVQIFGTDISELVIEKARAGIYLKNITADVSPARLSRFFVERDGGYQINKSIRDMCVFATQDVTKDHPFSRDQPYYCGH